MTQKLENHNFTYTTNPLICDKCGKHPSKHRLYPTMGICGTYVRTKNGLVSVKEEPYYPNLIEKILHFFGIHIWTDWIPFSKNSDYPRNWLHKKCLYPNCPFYKIK